MPSRSTELGAAVSLAWRGERGLAEAVTGPAPAGTSEPSLRAGRGRLRFERVGGATALVRCEASSPLQILSPRPRGPFAWAVLVSHGGGLLSGDRNALEVEVGAGATALVTTQAETKVYRAAEGGPATHELTARVAEGGALAFCPDAVSPFAGARYQGRQRYELAAGGSLLAVDAVVAGRSARGERWAFAEYRSRTELCIAGRRALSDALSLRADAPGEEGAGRGGREAARPLAARLGRFDGFATAVLWGPALARAARALLAEVAARPADPAPSLVAASPLADGALLRCAADDAGRLAVLVHAALAPSLESLGVAPFEHRW